MQKKYPFVLDTEYRLALGLSAAVFFVLFLIVFLPFGVSNYDPQHEYDAEFLMGMLLFGAATAVVILASEFLLRPRVPGTESRRGVIAWSAWTCLIVGLANFLLYNVMGDWHDFSLSSAAIFVVNSSAVLVFPLVGTFFYFRYRDLRSRFAAVLDTPSVGSDPDRLVTFSGSATGDRIVLRLADFLYGRAQDNYVELHYDTGGSLRRHLLRATLSGLANDTAGIGIERCHRSYIANLGRVVAVRGSGSELQLTLEGVEQAIPVSRTCRKNVLSGLRAQRGLSKNIPF